MDVTARFAALVAGDGPVPLDESSLLIAAHAHPALEVASVLARLDELAGSCPGPTVGTLARHLFVELGFRGNTDDYYDPENSFLDTVLDRRLGIPITLSILAIEVGRRLGLALHGVGMPGHFLVGTGDDLWLDPFNGATLLDREGCARRWSEVSGREATLFQPLWLAPTGERAILQRVLNNLAGIYEQRGHRDGLIWVQRLRCTFPDADPSEHGKLRRLLAVYN